RADQRQRPRLRRFPDRGRRWWRRRRRRRRGRWGRRRGGHHIDQRRDLAVLAGVRRAGRREGGQVDRVMVAAQVHLLGAVEEAALQIHAGVGEIARELAREAQRRHLVGGGVLQLHGQGVIAVRKRLRAPGRRGEQRQHGRRHLLRPAAG